MLLAFALLFFSAQADKLADIEGKVLDAVTNQPLAGARVILLRTDRGLTVISSQLWDTIPDPNGQDPKARTLAVVTDIDGAFRFKVEAPVKFYLFSDYGGYVRSRHGQSHTADSNGTTGILIRLTPEVSISGRVTDVDTGEPVRGLSVVARRRVSAGFGRLLVPAGRSGTADHNGAYRIAGLTPGEYYVEVRPPSGEKIGEPAPVKDFREAVQITYAPSWYPGVPRREEAAPISVLSGNGAEGIDIRIAKRRTASVRGRVFLAGGTLKPDETILLGLTSIERRFGAASFGAVAGGKVKPGAGFQIDRLAPGTYWLAAHTPGRTRAERLWAGITLHVGEENLDGQDLYLRKGFNVTGRVRIEGRDAKPDAAALPAEDIQANLEPVVRAPMIDEVQPVPVRGKNGSFTIQGVIADTYRIAISKPPSGYKVSELRYNGTLCPYGVVTIEAAASEHQLDVTLAPANASIAVNVTDGSRPSPGATLLLVPDRVEDHLLGITLRTVRADKDGRATVDGLLPGTYKMIAYPEGALWGEDPELKQRLAAGEGVQLAAGQVVMKQLRAVSSERR